MDDEDERKPPEHFYECPQRTDADAECKCEVNGIFCVCIICRRSFAKTEVWDLGRCPECQTTLKPMHPSAEVSVKVHWLELQTLACWAEQFAAMHSETCPDMKKAIYAITHEIETQYPLHAPLTLGRELGIMREKSPIVTNIGNVEPVPPKFRLQ